MSNIRFATCERQRALGFLKKFYPSYEITDSENSAKDILDLVEEDIVRIPDPDFHKDGAIFPSKNWHEIYKDAVVSACEKLTVNHD